MLSPIGLEVKLLRQGAFRTPVFEALERELNQRSIRCRIIQLEILKTDVRDGAVTSRTGAHAGPASNDDLRRAQYQAPRHRSRPRDLRQIQP